MGANFKIRRKSLFMKRMRVGSSGSYTQLNEDGEITQVGSASAGFLTTSIGGGTSLSAILAGSASFTATSTTAGSYESACATITGLTTGHKVFLTGDLSSGELIVTSACASAATELEVTYLNTGSAATADATLTLQYLAIRDA